MNEVKISKPVRLLSPIMVLFMFMFIMLAFSSVLAEAPTAVEDTSTSMVTPTPTITPLPGDDYYLEIGAEYVDRYNGGSRICPGWAYWGDCRWDNNDIPRAHGDAYSLVRVPISTYAYRSFYGNSYGSYARHRWAYSGYYMKRMDLLYFSGHGDNNGIYFRDWGSLRPNNCRGRWGGDMEWVVLSAGQVMESTESRNAWYQCMNGLHLLMGFETEKDDTFIGSWFAEYMRRTTLSQAWFWAADRTQHPGRVVWVIAEEPHQYNDRIYSHHNQYTTDYPNNNHYYYWRHQVGGGDGPSTTTWSGDMPVYNTQPLSLEEANNKWSELGQTFNVETSTRTSLRIGGNANEIWTSPDGQLQMDSSSGLFSFADLDRIWSVPTDTNRTATNQFRAISGDEARQIADEFLTSNGLMPADAEFAEVIPEVMQEVAITPDGRQRLLSSNTTMYQVLYSRILTYTPASRTGTLAEGEPVEFEVVGLGTQLKVYVAPQVSSHARSIAQAADEAIMGTVGGYRAVEPLSRSPVESIEILSYEQMESLFNELEPIVALNYMPMGTVESKEILSHTLAYYEHAMGTGQDQLIPVYALSVGYTLEGGDTTTDTIYIPSNPEFMPPMAALMESEGMPLTNTVAVGQEVVLKAVDASQTLAEMGYDASLDFTLGSNDPDSYLYTWYLNEVKEENKIGTGQELTYIVKAGESQDIEEYAPHDQPPSSESTSFARQTVILQVTDSLSPRPPSVNEFSIEFNVVPPLYLPLVTR